MTEKWYRRPQTLVALGVFIVALGAYALTVAPTTSFWDCGEYITTSHIVGIPHQPGTPMYVLMGRVFDIILGNADITEPALRTAWAVNFMSAFFSAMAVMFVYLIIWELARRSDPDSPVLAHIGGIVGAMFLAFSETYWNNAIEAEVYGLSACMVSLITWLAIRWYDHRESTASNNLLLMMVYLLGIGVGFHLQTLLVYPSIFVLVLVCRKRALPATDLIIMSAGLFIFLLSTSIKGDTAIKTLLGVYALIVIVRAIQGHRFSLYGSLLFTFGLTVHGMMLIRAGASPEPFINQTAPDNFEALMTVLRREQYPPINPFERQAPLGWQYGYYYKYLFNQFYFLGNGQGLLTTISTVLGPIFLALVGLFHGLRRIRLLIIVPLISYFINGEILTLYLNFTDHEVRDRDYFYFAAFLFFAVFIGLGASALLRYLNGGEGKSAAQIETEGGDWRRGIARLKPALLTKIVAGLLILVALLPISPGHTKFFEHDRSNNRIAYEYAWNILAGLDENAILFTNGDNDTFPIWYLQAVEHFRTDVTVVNLSLVNLPWYIKQLKYGDPPLDLTRTDAEIGQLRHRLFEDPDTGEQQLYMIKDYVLHDIMVTNRKSGVDRPVFFAVTIPQENMERYFSKLQMEGMAYRLTDTDSPDGQPTLAAHKVMSNMLGVYALDGLMTGDTAERHQRFKELAGQSSDGGSIPLGTASDVPLTFDFVDLAASIGEKRKDVFLNTNSRHLLGNYPAAFNRSGFEYYMAANKIALSDTALYQYYLTNAIAAFEASLAVHPYNQQATEFYPLLLVQAFRDQDAKDFLTNLEGKVSQEFEEQVIFQCLQGIVRGGVAELALEWLDERLAARPDRKFYYQVQFSLFRALGDRVKAQALMEAWYEQSGEEDPEMLQVLEEMAQAALQRENKRIEDAVGGYGGR